MICAGVGTYASFTTNVKTNNNIIKAGTVKLKNGEAKVKLFDLDNSRPGDYKNGDTVIDARNARTLPIKLSAQFTPVFKDKDGLVISDTSSYDFLEVQPVIDFYLNGSTNPDSRTLDWVPARILAETINNYKLGNQELNKMVFKTGEGIVLKPNVRLNGDAKDTYQGVSAEGELVVNASNN